MTLFSMHTNKSTGHDGLNPAFCQHFLNITINDSVNTCLNIFSFVVILYILNDTLEVLMREKNSPEFMNDLGPISLCNVMMKIVKKMGGYQIKVFAS